MRYFLHKFLSSNIVASEWHQKIQEGVRIQVIFYDFLTWGCVVNQFLQIAEEN
jgi:hypothetical protein